MHYGFKGLSAAFLVACLGWIAHENGRSQEPIGVGISREGCQLTGVLAEPKKDKDGKKDKDKDKEKKPVEVFDYLGYSFETWKKKINHEDPSIRETAMKAMIVFGPERAYTAVPDIIAQLKRHTANTPVDLAVCVNGTLTLSTIFSHKKNPDPKYIKEAIPIYKMFLNHSQVILKVRTVQALPYLGSESRVLLDDVIKVANDPMTWEVRKEGIQALAYMAVDDKGVPDKRVMPLFLQRQKHKGEKAEKSAEVRMAALNAIARIGRTIGAENKRVVVTEVRNTAETDPDDHVRITAHLTVLSLEHDPKAEQLNKNLAESHLVPLINYVSNQGAKGNDPSVRTMALHAIAVVGPLAKPWAYTTVIKTIDDSNVGVGVQACMTLIPMKAYEAKSHLKNIMEDKKAHEVIKEAAEDVYDQLGFMEKAEKEKKDKGKDKAKDKDK